MKRLRRRLSARGLVQDLVPKVKANALSVLFHLAMADAACSPMQRMLPHTP